MPESKEFVSIIATLLQRAVISAMSRRWARGTRRSPWSRRWPLAAYGSARTGVIFQAAKASIHAGGDFAPAAGMTWYTWLIAAALLTALAAVTGIKPKGTRHVAHTGLMGVARVVLVFIVLICLWFAIRA